MPIPLRPLLRAATRNDRPTTLLDVAEHLVRDPNPELHWIAYGLLERTIGDEPEHTWQLVRAEGRRAGEWATIDALAHVAAIGIAAEAYRWAELEQLVYSTSRWERRLAASTIATSMTTTSSPVGPEAGLSRSNQPADVFGCSVTQPTRHTSRPSTPRVCPMRMTRSPHSAFAIRFFRR